ncbi:DUF234 domain-containing protein [Cellulomonas sp. NTE-D12]|uniref:ATP-binding protein n=1 Tax=Cellulomonas sp. NTE-D12 TaxID=2962632 RepID=UPI0030818717|nr:ArsR family transcriptional regulator [Cellulomonas sp. NTE-D12]
MSGFVGRTRELGLLSEQLDAVRRGGRDARGAAVLLRGRRRVGKSRLVEELAARSEVPYVVFQAAKGAGPEREYAELATAVAASTLPDASLAADNRPATLTAALTLLAAALPDDRPSIVVLDEVPWLLEGIAGGAGELQRVWDRMLSRKPVLLMLLGSDLSMMEALTAPDAPFHGRGTEMVLEPLSPADVAGMTGLDAMAAFDAYLITGGLPLVAQEWRKGESPTHFLRRSFGSPLSALVTTGARVLDGEFREGELARRVLSAIGSGEAAFGTIQRAAGGDGPLQPGSLARVLGSLTARRVVAQDLPLSTARNKDPRYRIADPALRFWLRFVEPALAEVDRGRPDLAAARVGAGYEAWRGRAIEPVVREALLRLLVGTPWDDVHEVGGWWPRGNVPEVDLVGADRRPARSVRFAGTVKWRPGPLDRRDVDVLARDAVAVPGADAGTALVAVCPGGAVEDRRLARVWTAEDLLEAWS